MVVSLNSTFVTKFRIEPIRIAGDNGAVSFTYSVVYFTVSFTPFINVLCIINLHVKWLDKLSKRF